MQMERVDQQFIRTQWGLDADLPHGLQDAHSKTAKRWGK
jgi:hypothetical protein